MTALTVLIAVATSLTTAVILARGLARGTKALTPRWVIWLAFAVSITCFSIASASGQRLGWIGLTASVLGVAGCGWSWLFARALFRPECEPEAWWPIAVVAAISATGAVFILGGVLDGSDPLLRMTANVHVLASSSALLLAMLEPIQGFNGDLPRTERRFRLAIAAGYAALLVPSVLWVSDAGEGSLADAWRTPVQLFCALVALLGSAWAMAFRQRHPIAASHHRRRPRRAEPSSEDADLGQRIARLAGQPDIYTEPDLKVGDLAEKLGVPAYKVTQAITGPLGRRNFNQLMNDIRIEAAKRRLMDPSSAGVPVLTIALDSGFGSAGAFNRAFKERVGTTPRVFRQQAAQLHAAGGTQRLNSG